MYHSANYYYVQPQQVYYPLSWNFQTFRQYPPVDISLFRQSVTVTQSLVRDASTLLERIGEPTFANTLMTEAQAGNKEEVNRLLQTIGTSAPITATYTPTGVTLSMPGDVEGVRCCTLTLYLRWGW